LVGVSTTSTSHPRLLWVVDLHDAPLAAAVARLADRTGGTQVATVAAAVEAVGSSATDVVLLWSDRAGAPTDRDALLGTRLPVVLAGPTLHADRGGVWAEAAGLVVTGATPVHDIRVRPGTAAGALADRFVDHGHGSASHLGEHVHVHDRVLVVDKVADDVDVLLTAALGLTLHPVLTRRGDVLAWTLGTTPRGRGRGHAAAAAARARAPGPGGRRPRDPAAGGAAGLRRDRPRALRRLPRRRRVRARGRLRPQPRPPRGRCPQAPDVRTTTDAAALVEDPDVDVVVVSTPPDSHAGWALRALQAGKHVVVEKPFAIRTDEADAVLAQAEASGLLAVVYQNRRWDADHLAVREAVRAGRIGEVFHLETFVGGFGHPCNLWHSDADSSGGAFYDWGAHVLDQVLDLVPTAVDSVSATTHKRRWFDVTNADHSRVLLRFVDGTEAEFVHSDLAAALKPRWYVLGTDGAIVGSWRTEKVVARNDVGTLAEDVLAPADSPPVLDLYAADGSVTRLATPAPPPHPFHRELADALLLGLPMTVTGATSRRVLAVMEAASESAATGGRPVEPR
jgi:predicted dehydrogenase